MLSDRRRVAVALAGFCVFQNLYAPQSVLPPLAGEFAVGAGEASLAITASTLAVALIAPFTGTFADVPPGELLLYEDAYRTLALAVNRGSAAHHLGLDLDAEVRIRPG